ncbi:hypothetical protein N7447_002976 [Penicillium robsamsonii]|uniref:uncharacterized protein n=1 Tax=Penicillium robsamsonii TaxID=1792511 RepID=UPI0025479034|nr:uncharacterized protein N7447_002976 [Penicillium robsamsonii]KAJ5836950.1 hypothetical protein N7447_002976 [Penicillium robsamsonii]
MDVTRVCLRRICRRLKTDYTQRLSRYQCKVHCTAFLVTVYGRSVESPTLSLTPANPNIQPSHQRDYGGGSSLIAINELTNIPGELDATTNPSAENDLTECPKICLRINVLDLINWTRDTMRLAEVSFPMEADMLRLHMHHDLLYCLTIGQNEGQDSQPPHFSDVFEEIYRQHPENEYLTSLVNCAFGKVRNVILVDKEEQDKAQLAQEGGVSNSQRR